jgi:hypothetical protein
MAVLGAVQSMVVSQASKDLGLRVVDQDMLSLFTRHAASQGSDDPERDGARLLDEYRRDPDSFQESVSKAAADKVFGALFSKVRFVDRPASPPEAPEGEDDGLDGLDALEALEGLEGAADGGPEGPEGPEGEDKIAGAPEGAGGKPAAPEGAGKADEGPEGPGARPGKGPEGPQGDGPGAGGKGQAEP